MAATFPTRFLLKGTSILASISLSLRMCLFRLQSVPGIDGPGRCKQNGKQITTGSETSFENSKYVNPFPRANQGCSC